ncbi:MAG: carbohydrate kinase family protein [Patescibacteria group bacterium]
MNLIKGKLLVVGHLARDIVKRNSVCHKFWGGSAFHVSLAASFYLPVGQVVIKSRIGKDFDLSILKNLGIDISYLGIDSGKMTDRHWLNEEGGRRAFRSEGDLGKNIDIKDVEDIEGVGWIHLAASSPEQQLEWLEQIKTMGFGDVPISCDTFDTFTRTRPNLVKKVMEKCNLGFANEFEGREIGGENLDTDMVLKLGAKGAEYYSKGKLEVKAATIDNIEVRDTIGAGDVVAGVFIAQLLNGAGKKDALEEACRVASMSTMGFGTEHLVDRMGLGNNFTVEADGN